MKTVEEDEDTPRKVNAILLTRIVVSIFSKSRYRYDTIFLKIDIDIFKNFCKLMVFMFSSKLS